MEGKVNSNYDVFALDGDYPHGNCKFIGQGKDGSLEFISWKEHSNLDLNDERREYIEILFGDKDDGIIEGEKYIGKYFSSTKIFKKDERFKELSDKLFGVKNDSK